jgi:hypothetical protein
MAETEKAKTETLEFREKEKILQAELMTLMEEEKKMAMLKTKQTQKPPKTHAGRHQRCIRKRNRTGQK